MAQVDDFDASAHARHQRLLELEEAISDAASTASSTFRAGAEQPSRPGPPTSPTQRRPAGRRPLPAGVSTQAVARQVSLERPRSQEGFERGRLPHDFEALCDLIGSKAAARYRTVGQAMLHVNNNRNNMVERSEIRSFFHMFSLPREYADRFFDQLCHDGEEMEVGVLWSVLGPYILPGYKDHRIARAQSPGRASDHVNLAQRKRKDEMNMLTNLIGIKAAGKHRSAGECFRHFDDNKDGTVSYAEIARFVDHLSLPRTTADHIYQTLVSGGDGHGEGRVSFLKFMDTFGPAIRPGYYKEHVESNELSPRRAHQRDQNNQDNAKVGPRKYRPARNEAPDSDARLQAHLPRARSASRERQRVDRPVSARAGKAPHGGAAGLRAARAALNTAVRLGARHPECDERDVDLVERLNSACARNCRHREESAERHRASSRQKSAERLAAARQQAADRQQSTERQQAVARQQSIGRQHSDRPTQQEAAHQLPNDYTKPHCWSGMRQPVRAADGACLRYGLDVQMPKPQGAGSDVASLYSVSTRASSERSPPAEAHAAPAGAYARSADTSSPPAGAAGAYTRSSDTSSDTHCEWSHKSCALPGPRGLVCWLRTPRVPEYSQTYDSSNVSSRMMGDWHASREQNAERSRSWGPGSKWVTTNAMEEEMREERSPREAPGGRSNFEEHLPRGWASSLDPGTGRTYYYNETTRQPQWTRPVAEQATDLRRARSAPGSLHKLVSRSRPRSAGRSHDQTPSWTGHHGYIPQGAGFASGEPRMSIPRPGQMEFVHPSTSRTDNPRGRGSRGHHCSWIDHQGNYELDICNCGGDSVASSMRSSW